MGDVPIIGLKKNNPTNEYFIVGFMMDMKTYILPTPFGAPNKESAAAVCSFAVMKSEGNLSGFELYRPNPDYADGREWLMTVPVTQFMSWAIPQIQKITGRQVMRTMVPVKQTPANGQNLQALMDAAKKEEKQAE